MHAPLSGFPCGFWEPCLSPQGFWVKAAFPALHSLMMLPWRNGCPGHWVLFSDWVVTALLTFWHPLHTPALTPSQCITVIKSSAPECCREGMSPPRELSMLYWVAQRKAGTQETVALMTKWLSESLHLKPCVTDYIIAFKEWFFEPWVLEDLIVCVLLSVTMHIILLITLRYFKVKFIQVGAIQIYLLLMVKSCSLAQRKHAFKVE